MPTATFSVKPEKIEEFEDKQRRQQGKRNPIAPIERRSVEQCQEIVRTLPRHQFPPAAPSNYFQFNEYVRATGSSIAAGDTRCDERIQLRMKPSSSPAAQSIAWSMVLPC